jgi:hypothetical protein
MFFTASDFVSTKWSTAEEKAAFGNGLLQMPHSAFGAVCRARENAEGRSEGLNKAIKYRRLAKSSVGALGIFPVLLQGI